MRIETENRKMGEKSTGRNIPLLAEEWLRHQENAAKRPKRRRRGGQTCIPWIFAELTTPALRATPPLRGGE